MRVLFKYKFRNIFIEKLNESIMATLAITFCFEYLISIYITKNKIAKTLNYQN